jgi:hypothetical protein
VRCARSSPFRAPFAAMLAAAECPGGGRMGYVGILRRDSAAARVDTAAADEI